MRKANFCYEQNRKRENMPNWKAKRSNNFEHKRRVSHLIEILGIIMHIIFKEIKVNHIQTLMALEIKNLLIITATTLRILNIKNR